MTNLDDKPEIMIWKTHPTNSRICKRKEKKKARITQLKIYKYAVFLAIGGRGRIEYLQGRGRRSTRSEEEEEDD